MKYLKNFNEALRKASLTPYTDLKKELEEFCDTYLSYLKDNGFIIYIKREDNYTSTIKSQVTITISRPFTTIGDGLVTYRNPFKWGDIMDDFIPFYQVLKSKYKLIPYNRNCSISLRLHNQFSKIVIPDYKIENEDNTMDLYSINKLELTVF